MSLLARVVHPPSVESFTEREIHHKEKYIAVDENGFLQQSPETSGYDVAEGVFKVASYVWDADALTWVRATQGSGGGSSVAVSVKNKLFDQASASVLYIGEADPGASSSSPSWRIKRVSFDSGGFPTSVAFAAIGSATQIWDNRASLTY